MVEQKELPVLKPNYYNIGYSNLRGADIPTLTSYASHIGVSEEDMPEPTLEGYKFVGWYTSLNGGTQVKSIPAGTQKNYILYARWVLLNYEITYYNLQGAKAPSLKNYTIISDISQDDMPIAECPGYEFLGWYTEYEGGTRVFDIPKGQTGNIKLYARWSKPINYNIVYEDIVEGFNNSNNPSTYTVETETFKLYSPEWSGLVFDCWTDSKGTEVTEIKKGSYGDITLKANWIYQENYATTSSKTEAIGSYYDTTNGTYNFIYEAGTIDNVILEIIETVTKQPGQTINWTKGKEFSVEDSIAKSVSEAISESFTKSEAWETATNTAKNYSNSNNWSLSGTGSIESGFDSTKVHASITTSTGASNSFTDTYSTTTTKGGGNSSTTDKEKAFSSTVAYVKNSKTSLSTSITISDKMPTGKYSLACVGTAKVYVVVTYNPTAKQYHLNTYAILENNFRTAPMYTPATGNTVNISEHEPIAYSVPMTNIKEYINSSYYTVKYSANGGSGTMANTTMYRDIKQPLSANQFKKTGYTFDGWLINGKKYANSDIVLNLTTAKNTITATAQWKINTYSITYNKNSGDFITSSHPSSYTVTSIPSISDLKHSKYPNYINFLGWYEDSSYYKKFDVNTLKTNPRNLTLYAKWDSTIYSSIDDTPWCPASGKTVIDWSNETDTNLLNHTNRNTSGNGTRYDNMDIYNNATEVTFIGDSSKTYTNFHMYICLFEKGQNLTIRFVNFKFTTNTSAAIGVHADNGAVITIDVVGDCVIDSSYNSGSIILTPYNDVTVTGSGTLTVKGGKGSDGSGDGGTGESGGTAIYAEKVNVDMNSSTGKLNVYGGAGGNGSSGVNANGGDLGETGHTGGNGGNGGAAIKAYSGVYLINGTININGGAGGNGGNGGKGDEGHAIFDKDGNGGAGGSGGAGGYGILGSVSISSNVNSTSTIRGGTGGNGGNGGNGGSGGANESSGGSGGAAGTGGSAFSSLNTSNYNVFYSAGKNGSNGSNGTGT